MEERFDNEEKKHSGFGKGFFGGFVAAFVLMGVVVAGMLVGRSLAGPKHPVPGGQQSSQTNGGDESESGQETQAPVVQLPETILDEAFVEEINTIYEQMQYYYLYDIQVVLMNL